MQAYWITFTDGTKACCEGKSEYDAKVIAEKFTGKEVGGGKYSDFTMVRLPYPANPVIWQFDHPLHGKCPAFCFRPDECAGKGSCPQSYACTE